MIHVDRHKPAGTNAHANKNRNRRGDGIALAAPVSTAHKIRGPGLLPAPLPYPHPPPHHHTLCNAGRGPRFALYISPGGASPSRRLLPSHPHHHLRADTAPPHPLLRGSLPSLTIPTVLTATPPTRPCGLSSANRSSIPNQTLNACTVADASSHHHPRFLDQPPSRRSAPTPRHVLEPEDLTADRALETHLEWRVVHRGQHDAVLEVVTVVTQGDEINAFS